MEQNDASNSSITTDMYHPERSNKPLMEFFLMMMKEIMIPKKIIKKKTKPRKMTIKKNLK